MELTKVTNCVWFYPFEKERDRPILGYIKGDHFSVAVDAGHSEAHTKEFYSENNRPYALALGSYFWYARCQRILHSKPHNG